jgi:hypothetical protein
MLRRRFGNITSGLKPAMQSRRIGACLCRGRLLDPSRGSRAGDLLRSVSLRGSIAKAEIDAAVIRVHVAEHAFGDRKIAMWSSPERRSRPCSDITRPRVNEDICLLWIALPQRRKAFNIS